MTVAEFLVALAEHFEALSPYSPAAKHLALSCRDYGMIAMNEKPVIDAKIAALRSRLEYFIGKLAELEASEASPAPEAAAPSATA